MSNDHRPLPRSEELEERPRFDAAHSALQLVGIFGAEHSRRSAESTPKGSPHGNAVDPANEISVVGRRSTKTDLECVLNGVERDLWIEHGSQNSAVDIREGTAVERFPSLWIDQGHTY